MAQETKQVILDIQVTDKIEQAINKVVELQRSVKELQTQQEEYKNQLQKGEISQQEYSESMVQSTASIKALQSQIKDYNKLLQNQYKESESVQGSMNQLSAKLSQLKAIYRNLSEEERNSEAGKTIQENAKLLNDQLLELEKSYGQFGRQVGNYEIVSNSLRQELKELTAQLSEMKLAGQDNTEQYRQLIEKAAQIKDAIADTSAEVKNLADDTHALNGAIELFNGLQSTVSATSIALNKLGFETEDYNAIMQSLQETMALFNSLQQIQNMLQKQSAATLLANNILTKTKIALSKLFTKTQKEENATVVASTLAEKARAVATNISTVAQKAATLATKAFNAALKSNPIIAIISLIVALGTAVVKLTKYFSASARAQRELAKQEEEYNQIAEETADNIEKLEKQKQDAINETDLANRKKILEMKKAGATEEEIAEATYQNEIQKMQVTIEATEKIIKAKQEELKQKQALISAMEIEMSKLKKNSDEYKEHAEKIKEYKNQIKALNSEIAQGQNQMASDRLSIEEKKFDHDNKKKNTSTSGKNPQEEAYKKEKKLMEDRQKLSEKQLELEKANAEESLTTQLKYEDKEFLQKQEHEKKKLALELKYKKISQEEYQRQNELLAKDNEIYYTQRNKKLQDALKKELSTLQQSEEEQIKLLQEENQKKIREYTAMIEEQYGSLLTADNEATAENSEAQRLIAEYSLAIYQKEQQQEEKIRKESLAKRLEEAYKQIDKQNERDLILFADNEQKKTEIEISQLEARIKARESEGLTKENDSETLQLYQTLEEKRSALRKASLDFDLATTLKTEKQKFEAQREYLLKEIELQKDGTLQKAELQKQLFELESSYNQQRLEQVQNYVSQVTQIASEFNNLLKAQEESKTAKYEEENEKQKNSLQQRLDAGLISQENYDKQVAQADAKLEKQKKKIAREQALRERVLKVFEITANTAAGVMQAFAQMGPIAGIPLAAVVSAMGSLQLATVLATPLPKAKKGGLIKGKRHSQGGEIIEVEDGEMIINREATMRNKTLLQSINSGAVDFVPSVATSNNVAFSESLASLSSDIQNLKLFVAVEDINRGQKNYAQIEQAGTF